MGVLEASKVCRVACAKLLLLSLSLSLSLSLRCVYSTPTLWEAHVFGLGHVEDIQLRYAHYPVPFT